MSNTFYNLSKKAQRQTRNLTRYVSHPYPTPYQKRIFFTWLRRVWLDILVMSLLLALAFSIRAFNTPIYLERSRIFPMNYSREDLWYGPAYISRPREKLRLDNLKAGLCFTLAPLIVIIVMQVFIRSFWDMNAAVFGLLKGLAVTYVSSKCFFCMPLMVDPTFLVEIEFLRSLLYLS